MVIHIHNTYYVYGVHTNTVIGDFVQAIKIHELSFKFSLYAELEFPVLFHTQFQHVL